jgi:thiol-disulfide isomerase/thioredoxin
MKTLTRAALAAVALSLSFGIAHGEDKAKRPSKATEGELAPELSVSGWKNAKGELKMDDLAGQVVVLKFWAVWCPNCKSGLPPLSKMASVTYKDKKVTFVAIHDKKDHEKMAAFVDRNKLLFTCCEDTDGATFKAFGGGKEIPYNVLIDKKGKVRKLDWTIDEKEIDKLLAE